MTNTSTDVSVIIVSKEKRMFGCFTTVLTWFSKVFDRGFLWKISHINWKKLLSKLLSLTGHGLATSLSRGKNMSRKTARGTCNTWHAH